MDGSYFSAMVGLAGAAIGGLTSFATSWVTQRAQMREKGVQAEHNRRERLYTAFIDEATRLFGDALNRQNDDLTMLVQLYALVARMRLVATPPVIEAAEGVAESVITTYQGPNRTLRELHLFAHTGGMDPLLRFSEACRDELLMRRR